MSVTKVEYRVRPVTRYVVTRYYEGDRCGGCEGKGEFDNAETAYAVGYALAKFEHEQLGWPAGDMRMMYPSQIQSLVTTEMVDRFLGWKLPSDFAPDCGINFTPLGQPHGWPVGTNLFTATQARAMLDHVLRSPTLTAPVDMARFTRTQ